MLVIFIVLGTGFVKHGSHFQAVRAVRRTDDYAALMVVIRSFPSLSVLSASIASFREHAGGHILLKVFAGMSAGLAASGMVIRRRRLALAFNIVIVAFEFFAGAFAKPTFFSILGSVLSARCAGNALKDG